MENLERPDKPDNLFIKILRYIIKFLISTPFHAVLIDNNFNIVHDPNPNYKGILKYPLADILGYNGIIKVDGFKKMRIR